MDVSQCVSKWGLCDSFTSIRLRKRDKLNLPKRRNVTGRLESLEDRVAASLESYKPVGEKECLEMEECDADKDKDYYFMDANLIGWPSACVYL